MTTYVAFDRSQAFLLPPGLKDWLPADDADPQALPAGLERPGGSLRRRGRNNRSIALKRCLYLAYIAGRRQHQHEEDAGLLRREILAGDDAGFAQPAARGDAAARGGESRD